MVGIASLRLTRATTCATIELEENLRRKNLEPHERSKFRMAVKEQAGKNSSTCGMIPQVEQKFHDVKARKTGGSTRDTAAKAGVDEKTVRNASAHVAAVERYPFMQRWPQSSALEAGKLLDGMSEITRRYGRYRKPASHAGCTP